MICGAYPLNPQGYCSRGDANGPDAKQRLVQVVMGATSFAEDELCGLHKHYPFQASGSVEFLAFDTVEFLVVVLPMLKTGCSAELKSCS